MAIRKVPFVVGEFYHIYTRGNSKQAIFLDNYDRERFIQLLYLCNSIMRINYREDIVRADINAWEFDRKEKIVFIGSWVLMPNHFHLYLTPKNLPKSDFGKSGKNLNKNNITEFMRKLLTSYSKYFNKKYSRAGGLFESNFKSVHINNDPQAKYVFSYIHLNPVKLIDSKWRKNGIKDWKKVNQFLENYLWSSYLDYKGVIRSYNKILNKEVFPEYFQNIKNCNAEMKEWLMFSEED